MGQSRVKSCSDFYSLLFSCRGDTQWHGGIRIGRGAAGGWAHHGSGGFLTPGKVLHPKYPPSPIPEHLPEFPVLFSLQIVRRINSSHIWCIPAPTCHGKPELIWDVPWLKLQNYPRLYKTWEFNILNTLHKGLGDLRVFPGAGIWCSDVFLCPQYLFFFNVSLSNLLSGLMDPWTHIPPIF